MWDWCAVIQISSMEVVDKGCIPLRSRLSKNEERARNVDCHIYISYRINVDDSRRNKKKEWRRIVSSGHAYLRTLTETLDPATCAFEASSAAEPQFLVSWLFIKAAANA